MARAVKRRILFIDVVDEVGKKGRQHRLFIAAGQAFGSGNATALIDHFFRQDDVDLVDIRFRQFLTAGHDDHDGDAESCLGNGVNIRKILIRQDGYGDIGKVRFFNGHDVPVAVDKVILYVKTVSYF